MTPEVPLIAASAASSWFAPTGTWLAALVFVPLLGVLVSVFGTDRWRRAAGLVSATAASLLTGLVVAGVVRGELLGHDMSAFAPPLGISLAIDGVAAVFLGVTAVVGLLVSLAAAAEPRLAGSSRFWPLWLLTWAGLAATFLSRDLFNLYVGLELVGLGAVGMVVLGGREAWPAALRYLMVTVLGSMLVLVAVAAVYGATGTLDIALASERLDGAGARVPLALACVGLALKCALVPLHSWLPAAHTASPGAVSPLLSALVVKAAFFVLLRLWFDVFGPDPVLGVVLGALGALAVVWGGLAALGQSRLKPLVAYSTVSQMGYLFLVFPLSLHPDSAVRTVAWTAMVMLVAAHALAKASIFLTAGAFKVMVGSDELTEISGIARRERAMTLATGIASVSLIGLPITLGFSGKWQLLVASSSAGMWWIVAVALAGTLLAAGYLLRPVAAQLRSSDIVEEVEPARPERFAAPARYAGLTLAGLVLLLGFAGDEVASLAVTGAPPHVVGEAGVPAR